MISVYFDIINFVDIHFKTNLFTVFFFLLFKSEKPLGHQTLQKWRKEQKIKRLNPQIL